MANEYNVIEDGTIVCACGGKVSLISTVEGKTIGGKKPLYLKDLLNAPVFCPRNTNKCTKVVAISTAGTQTNVSASGKTYLLRTDGFVTDKGRAVILKNPGQYTSRISDIPSLENQDVKPEDEIEAEKKIHEENISKEKYKLYFLRKSQETYKPIRPTRAFRDSLETHSSDLLDEFNDTSIHSHTMAYLYITQNNKTSEYKIFSQGNLYNEETKDIFYQNTKTKVKLKYIPIYEDSNIYVSYSNIKLYEKNDIKKLEKLSFPPSSIDNKSTLYIKNEDDINLRQFKNEDIEKLKYKPLIHDQTKNIVCIIEDVLAQIEDMYLEYHNNYKFAYRKNHDIIEKIKKNNSYAYTICNLVDFFHMNKSDQDSYNKELVKLKDFYNELVVLLLSDEKLVDSFFVKDQDISKILDNDKFKVSASKVTKIGYLKENFFTEKIKDEKVIPLLTIRLTKEGFATDSKKIEDKRYFYTINKRMNRTFITKIRNFSAPSLKESSFNQLEFNSSNDDFTLLKKDARLIVANLVFAIFFSDEYEDILKQSREFSKIQTARDGLFELLNTIVARVNISDESLESIQKGIRKSDVYWNTIGIEKDLKDKYINVYDNLDHEKKIQSFKQDGEKLKFDTKYLYYEKQNYYKNDGELKIPENILKEIKNKLQEEKLKDLLSIYKNIKYKDELDNFHYVISAMNIIYMLCTPRTYLDEETNITTFFNDELKHVYEYLVDMINKRIELKDDKKDILNVEYNISDLYNKMFINLCLHNIMQTPKASTSKAIKLIRQFKRSNVIKENEDNKKEFKHPYSKAQNLKSSQREFYESLKTMEGYTAKIEGMLEEIQNKFVERRSITNTKFISTHDRLKNFSQLIAVANTIDYLFLDEEKKTIKSHVGFVNDMMVTSLVLGNIVRSTKKIPSEILTMFFSDKSIKNITNSHKKLLTLSEKSNPLLKNAIKRGSVVTIFVTIIYDSKDLIENEDYDTLFLTTLAASIAICLVVMPVTLLVSIVGTIITIVFTYIATFTKESSLDMYFIRSLFYKIVDFSLIKAVLKKAQKKQYQAKYLFETTNKNEKLKAISSDGFNNDIKLIEFIGKNYKGNEKYFDTALQNELSFFKAALLGYKLEETRYKSEKIFLKFKNMQEIVKSYDGVKIPKDILDDSQFKLFFAPSDGNYLEIDKKSLIEDGNHYIFNLFPEDKDYYPINSLNNKYPIKIKSNIIVKSSIVNLKYELTILIVSSAITFSKLIIDVNIDKLKQISFSENDIRILEENKIGDKNESK